MDVVDQGSVGRWLRWRKIEAQAQNKGGRLWSKWKMFSFTPCSAAFLQATNTEDGGGSTATAQLLNLYSESKATIFLFFFFTRKLVFL